MCKSIIAVWVHVFEHVELLSASVHMWTTFWLAALWMVMIEQPLNVKLFLFFADIKYPSVSLI